MGSALGALGEQLLKNSVRGWENYSQCFHAWNFEEIFVSINGPVKVNQKMTLFGFEIDFFSGLKLPFCKSGKIDFSIWIWNYVLLLTIKHKFPNTGSNPKKKLGHPNLDFYLGSLVWNKPKIEKQESGFTLIGPMEESNVVTIFIIYYFRHGFSIRSRFPTPERSAKSGTTKSTNTGNGTAVFKLDRKWHFGR